MNPPELDINALRQALTMQAQARQQPIGYPVNPTAMRVAPNQALPSGAPNTPGVPVPNMPAPAPAAPVNVSRPAGGAAPQQQMAGAAQTAQSPVFDPETRDIAKALVQKLLKHL